MPELRQEPITNNWVIIATERSKRPSDFPVKQEKRKGGKCPFCEGNEGKTPPEIMSYREGGTKADTPGWWVRVVPNLFPALSKTDNDESNGGVDGESVDLFVTKPGIGAHEVLVESPEHNSSLETHTPKQVIEIFYMWRDRYQALLNEESIQYIQLFKNEGSIAGASLEHPHSQLIATPLIPPTICEELNGAQEYYQQQGKCIYCDMLKYEQENSRRIVADNQDFLAFCPFASRFPFETWIIPKEHQAGFDLINKGQLENMGAIVQEVTQKIKGSLNGPPYNMVLHSAPVGNSDAAHYHWHLEIIPRLTIVAGFEWGTGIIINPTPPESAANYLRETNIEYFQEKESVSWQQIH